MSSQTTAAEHSLNDTERLLPDQPQPPLASILISQSATSSNLHTMMSHMDKSSYTKPALLIPFAVILFNVILLYVTPLSQSLPYTRLTTTPAQCAATSFLSEPQQLQHQLQSMSHPLTISALREVTRDKHIHFVGDSTMRDTYFEYTSILKREPVGATIDPTTAALRYKTRHDNQLVRIGSMRMTFSWKPFVYDVVNELERVLSSVQQPDLIIVSAGLHDLLYSNATHVDNSINVLKQLATARVSSAHRILWKSSPAILDAQLKGNRANSQQFRDRNLVTLNSRIEQALTQTHLAYVNDHDVTAKRAIQLDDDGLHSKQASVQAAVSVAAYTHCSIGLLKFQLTAGQITLLVVVAAIVALLAYTAVMKQISMRSINGKPLYSPLNGNDTDIEAASPMTHSKSDMDVSTNGANGDSADTKLDASAAAAPQSPTVPKHFDLVSFVQSNDAQTWMYAALQLALVLLIVYALDGDFRLTWSIVGDKKYDRDLFIFICLAILAYAYTTTQSLPSSKLFQVQQTGEWKGWMQIMFVLYHYWKAEETYNLIRIFIAAYVWQTGYGYFIKFNRDKPDFSFITFMKSMFRLNFFVSLICITLNRDYMQYYVCPLHTFFTIFVYALMYAGHTSGWNSGSKLAIKFGVALLLLIAVWDIPQTGLFNVMFDYRVMKWHNSLYEWRFRSTLDHFATWVGCICAWQFNNIERILIRIEAKGRAYQAAFATAVCAVLCIWYVKCYQLNKFAYNAQHAYTSFIPIIGYLLLRNMTTGLRSKYLHAFTWVGAITLETYILQFHVWLSDDAATIIKYTSGYPLLNFVLSSCIYLCLSKVVSDLTGTLSNALISKNITTQQLVYRMAVIACGYTTLYTASQAVLLTQAH